MTYPVVTLVCRNLWWTDTLPPCHLRHVSGAPFCKNFLGVPVGIACAESGGVEEAPRPKMRENELLSLATYW